MNHVDFYSQRWFELMIGRVLCWRCMMIDWWSCPHHLILTDEKTIKGALALGQGQSWIGHDYEQVDLLCLLVLMLKQNGPKFRLADNAEDAHYSYLKKISKSTVTDRTNLKPFKSKMQQSKKRIGEANAGQNNRWKNLQSAIKSDTAYPIASQIDPSLYTDSLKLPHADSRLPYLPTTLTGKNTDNMW